MYFFVYVVKCADGSYYTGSHRGTDVTSRVHDHNNGLYPNAYTFTRRPVELVWSAECVAPDDMGVLERQIKGWSRAKKEALINGELDKLPGLSKRKS